MANTRKKRKVIPKKKDTVSDGDKNASFLANDVNNNKFLSQRKNLKTLSIFIPRRYNHTLPKDIKISAEEISFWNDFIFTENNFLEVRNASKTRINGRSERDKVIQDIVVEQISNKVKVFKYDDKTQSGLQLTINEVVDYVQKKFIKKLSAYSKINKDLEVDDEVIMQVLENEDMKRTRAILPSLKEVVKKKKYTPINSIPRFEDFHDISNMNNEVFHPNWNWYSMIHSLYESFSFVLYNGSHRIQNGEVTHKKSRVVLKFPAEPNMFIIFSGNLVHSGACSKFEPHPYTFYHAADIRAFGYLQKKDLSRVCRRKEDNLLRRDSHNANPRLGTSYIGCNKMENPNAKCDKCDEYKNKHTMDGFEINLKTEYDRWAKMKNKSMNIEPIAGNLIDYGWAVYDGINVRDVNEVGNLFNDLKSIVHKYKWKQIQTPTPHNASRYQFPITTLHLPDDSKENKTPYLGSVEFFYKKVLTERVRYIDGFESARITEGHLLRNQGDLVEQRPHKDYEAVGEDI